MAGEYNIPDEIVVYHSRWKMALIALGALMFVGAAIPIWTITSTARGLTLLTLLALIIVDVLFFGACLLYALKRLRASTPALVLDAKGIYDDSSATGAGFVAWKEIASAHIGAVQLQRFLCLVPRDIDAFLQRQPPWKRRLMHINTKLVGAPITISAVALPMPLDQLTALVERRLREVRPDAFYN